MWLAEDRAPTFSSVRSSPPEVEIVGGGVTGCSCALTLARAGVRVRLHEARQIAGGASGRNGGFALRGGAQPYDRAAARLGHDVARSYWRVTEEYLDRYAELAPEAFRRTGSLRIAVDAAEHEELRAEFDSLRADGLEAEWREELPPPLAGFGAAIFHPRDASFHPARAVRRLARAAAGAGAELVEHDRVESLDELEAERVVVATDGYPSGLLGDLEGLIVSTRGQMLATEPLAERLFDMPHYSRYGFDYWQQLDDGRIVAGGFRDLSLETEFTEIEETTPTIQGALERFVEGLVGRPLTIERRWAGIFGGVPDLLPVVGQHPADGRVWIAGGYSGHGNVLGFLCGHLVAQAVLGDVHPLLETFAPGRLVPA